MANKEISELTNKATPIGTDEIEIQETGGGTSKKTSLQAIWDNISTSTIDVNGGSIDGAVIGATTPAAANVTDLDVSGSFTATGSLTTQSTTPQNIFIETDASTDNKRWDVFIQGEQFQIRAVNDANDSANNAVTINRTDESIDSVAFGATAIFAGSFSGHPSGNSYGTAFWDSTGGLVLSGDEGSSGDTHRFTNKSGSTILALANSLDAEFFGSIIMQSGEGLDFSAAGGGVFDYADADTWSPVIADASSGGNTSGGSVAGTFVRVGDFCIASVASNNLTTAGMTGGNDLYVRNLPFTSHSTGSYSVGPVASAALVIATNHHTFTCRVDNSSTVGRIYENGDSTTTVKVSDVNTGVTDIDCTFIYRVA